MANEPRATPPAWLNRLMSWMLRTPGLQRLVGRSTCLLTFTGRRTGKTYTTPISHVRQGNEVILTCHPSRQWWRNLDAHPEVTVRLRGQDIQGRGRVVEGEESAERLAAFLAQQRILARSMGLRRGENDAYSREDISAAAADTIVVLVSLARP